MTPYRTLKRWHLRVGSCGPPAPPCLQPFLTAAGGY